MRRWLFLPLVLAACGMAPDLTTPAQSAAQANMLRLEGTSLGNPIAAAFTACVVSGANPTELGALSLAQSRAEMDAIIAGIVARPEAAGCLDGVGLGGAT